MERLQKVLAQAGIASRRAAEQIISAGRVRVDGKIVRELGTQVDPRKSRIEVDGNKIVAEKLIYIVLHKPRGVVCTLSDPEGRPTIAELVKDAGARVVPIGRLDFHTSGALLCTNDGEFAQALAHPTRGVPKVYVAKVKGAVDDEALEKFGQRIVIEGRPTQPAQVTRLRFEGDKTWLEVTLREGRNRQVRRLGEATGFPVMRLARISHAGVTSEDLRPGQWRPLTVDELVDLKRDYGVPKKVRTPVYVPTAGRGGWDEARVPGARRVEPRFSAAKRSEPKRSSSKRGEAKHERHSGQGHARPEAARGDARGRAPQSEVVRRAALRRPQSENSEARGGEPRSGAHRPSAARSEARGAEPKRSAARFETRGAKFNRPVTKRPQPDREARAETPKPFSARHREKKRFDAKNAEPKAFDATKRATKGGGTRADAKRGPEPARVQRGASPQGPRNQHRQERASSRGASSRSDERGSGPRRGTSR